MPIMLNIEEIISYMKQFNVHITTYGCMTYMSVRSMASNRKFREAQSAEEEKNSTPSTKINTLCN